MAKNSAPNKRPTPRPSESAPNAPPEPPEPPEPRGLSVSPLDFAARLAAALGQPLAGDVPIAVAVSGGPDSLALLWLAGHAFPGRVTALTVDHGLRPTSAAEAAGVAVRCAALGIPHATLCWVGDKPQADIQAAARAARYALMGEWCAAIGVPMLLTAHHADDQAETLLMRLQRGSGSAGLAGIRAARPLAPGVMLVRPLLGVRRATLGEVIAAAGWVGIDDPANADGRYDRTAARALLAATPTLDPTRLAAVAAHLGEAETALAWAAERAWAGAAVIDGDAIALDIAGLPDELARRLLVRAILTLAPGAAPPGPAIAALQRRLVASDSGTIAGVKASGGAIWRFNRAAARRKQR